MYTLYAGKFSRALLVEMVLTELDIDYRRIDLDLLAEEQKTAEFLKINPSGWIPALVLMSGEVLYETAAINLYLAENHAPPSLAPSIEDPYRGQFLSTLFAITNDIEPAMKRYFYPHRYVLNPNKEIAQSVETRALQAIGERLKPFESRLDAGAKHLINNRFSIVDITLAYWVHSLPKTFDFSATQGVKSVAEETINRPKLKPMFDQLRIWMDEYEERKRTGTANR